MNAITNDWPLKYATKWNVNMLKMHCEIMTEWMLECQWSRCNGTDNNIEKLLLYNPFNN